MCDESTQISFRIILVSMSDKSSVRVLMNVKATTVRKWHAPINTLSGRHRDS